MDKLWQRDYDQSLYDFGVLRQCCTTTVAEHEQFNGEYGCGFCLNSGCVVAKGQGYSRSYAHSVAGLPEERNHAQMLQHAETALHSGSVEFGIRGLASCCLCLNLMWCEHLCQITCIVCCKQITILLTASPPPAGYIRRLQIFLTPHYGNIQRPAYCLHSSLALVPVIFYVQRIQTSFTAWCCREWLGHAHKPLS